MLGDRPEQVVYTLAEQSRQKHGTYVLITLLVMAVISLLALLAALVFQVLNPEAAANRAPAPIVQPPAGHSTLRPELFHAQGQQDIFDPIAERDPDAEPLTEEEIFGPVQELSLSGMELTLRESEVTDTCTALVWGEELAQTLSTGACTSAARGVYLDSNGEYVAQFTLFDLADAEAATATLEAWTHRSPGFVLPMQDDIKDCTPATARPPPRPWVTMSRCSGSPGPTAANPPATTPWPRLNVAAMDAALVVYEQVRDAKEGEGLILRRAAGESSILPYSPPETIRSSKRSQVSSTESPVSGAPGRRRKPPAPTPQDHAGRSRGTRRRKGGRRATDASPSSRSSSVCSSSR